MAVTITNDAATTRTNLGLGDAATKTVGTASGNIPVLDSSGDLPTSTYTNTDTVYTHPTTAGNKHIPTSGAADQVLTYSASGTAAWADAAAGGASYADSWKVSLDYSVAVASNNRIPYNISEGGSTITFSSGKSVVNINTAGVYLIWTQSATSSGGTDIRLRTSDDNGSTWVYQTGRGHTDNTYDVATAIYVVNLTANSQVDVLSGGGSTYYGTGVNYGRMTLMAGVKIG